LGSFPSTDRYSSSHEFLPIALSILLAWWAMRRLGSAVLEPLPLVSLVATSLSLRLVFEDHMIGYYPMAMAVSLVMLDVIRGRISLYMVAWLGLVALAFYPLPWEFRPTELRDWLLILAAAAYWADSHLAGRQMSSGIVLAVGSRSLRHALAIGCPLINLFHGCVAWTRKDYSGRPARAGRRRVHTERRRRCLVRPWWPCWAGRRRDCRDRLPAPRNSTWPG
jgi:hypothetical protein